MKVPLGGGSTTTLASGQSTPMSVAVDAASVYWTNFGTAADNFMDGTVMSAPLDGGTATTLASEQSTPVSIVVDATSVYWLDVVGSGNAVMKVAKP
jgi:hypothetical protein